MEEWKNEYGDPTEICVDGGRVWQYNHQLQWMTDPDKLLNCAPADIIGVVLPLKITLSYQDGKWVISRSADAMFDFQPELRIKLWQDEYDSAIFTKEWSLNCLSHDAYFGYGVQVIDGLPENKIIQCQGLFVRPKQAEFMIKQLKHNPDKVRWFTNDSFETG
jgi:hypothetical protein